MDTNLALQPIIDLIKATALLVGSDTRTLEDDNKVGSYIRSAEYALRQADQFLEEARQLEQDAYEARPLPTSPDFEVEGAPF